MSSNPYPIGFGLNLVLSYSTPGIPSAHSKQIDDEALGTIAPVSQSIIYEKVATMNFYQPKRLLSLLSFLLIFGCTPSVPDDLVHIPAGKINGKEKYPPES